jgi:endo-1,4-beta-xylanase
VFSKRLGAIEQIDLAFRLTREYAPNAQLVYNDYMGPSSGNATHRAGVLKLLAELRKRGTPIDALGLQSHIGIHDAMTASAAGRQAEREWRSFLDEVTGMGYDLLVSEFDVSDKGMPQSIATRDAATAALARDYLELTLSYPNCRDFLLWGLSDNVSWLQEWKDAKRPDGLPQRPTPWDSRLRPKPMRATIAQVLRDIPMRKA